MKFNFTTVWSSSQTIYTKKRATGIAERGYDTIYLIFAELDILRNGKAVEHSIPIALKVSSIHFGTERKLSWPLDCAAFFFSNSLPFTRPSHPQFRVAEKKIRKSDALASMRKLRPKSFHFQYMPCTEWCRTSSDGQNVHSRHAIGHTCTALFQSMFNYIMCRQRINSLIFSHSRSNRFVGT